MTCQRTHDQSRCQTEPFAIHALYGKARHAVEKRHVALYCLLEETGVLLAVAARSGVVGLDQIHLAELNEHRLLICLHSILPWKSVSCATRRTQTACPCAQNNPPFGGHAIFMSEQAIVRDIEI